VHLHLSDIWLLTFWLDKPASWFLLAESHFRIHNVMREITRFDLLVSSLTKESVGLVLDIVENSPQHRPYSFLQDKFQATHQLTEHQRIVHLRKIGASRC
jgi:hypothetical protein